MDGFGFNWQDSLEEEQFISTGNCSIVYLCSTASDIVNQAKVSLASETDIIGSLANADDLFNDAVTIP